MSSRPIWPQPPASPQKTFSPAVPQPPQPTPPAATPAPLTHVGNSPRPATRPLSYTEQLRQVSSAQAAPYVELLRSAVPDPTTPPLPADRSLREALIELDPIRGTKGR